MPSPSALPVSAAAVVPALAAKTSAAAATSTAAVVQPLATTTPPLTLQAVVHDLLRWLGLSALHLDRGVPALPVPPPLDGLWFAVRRVERTVGYTFSNRAPVATATVDPEQPRTGVITGNIVATDADGDKLTYRVSEQPAHGTVTLDQLTQAGG